MAVIDVKLAIVDATPNADTERSNPTCRAASVMPFILRTTSNAASVSRSRDERVSSVLKASHPERV